MDDETVLEMLIRSFHENQKLKEERSLLQERNADLSQRIDDAERSIKQLEKDLRSTEKNRDNLQRRYRSLCSRNEHADPSPVMVEKVVYREDRRAVDELRDKCDKLKERLWEHQTRGEEMRSQLERLEVLEARDSDWKREFHGIILRARDGSALPPLELRLLGSKAYFQHRADPETFKERHHLNGPFQVKELPYGD